MKLKIYTPQEYLEKRTIVGVVSKDGSTHLNISAQGSLNLLRNYAFYHTKEALFQLKMEIKDAESKRIIQETIDELKKEGL